MRKITGIVVLMTALVAACGGDPQSNSPASVDQPAAASPSAAQQTTEAEPTEVAPTEVVDDPAVAAAALAAAIPDIGEVIEITEDNDPNNLIGRPGEYDAATFMQDKRLDCTDADNFNDLSVDCGAKIERWASQADAQARADYIQQMLKEVGFLGSEYDYISGVLLLRVAGDLKPSQAKAYEEAFLG